MMSLLLSQPKTEISSNVVATAAFDPPAIRPGQESVYRVTFNALEPSVEWPDQVPAPADLGFRKGGQGQVLLFSGTNYAPRTTFNYHARPSRLGQFSVPQFTVNVYGKPVPVPLARLSVLTSPPAPLVPAPQLLFGVPETNLYVGQGVRAQVMLPVSGAGPFLAMAQVQINGEGLLAEPGVVRQQVSNAGPRGGVPTITNIYETTITPISAGKLTVFAQSYAVGNRFAGPVVFTGPGGTLQYLLLDSDPIELTARPLPRQGQLPGFTGAIGKFTLDPPRLATNLLRVGDTVQLTVVVRGNGNLARLAPPPPPQTPEWQVFAAKNETLPPQALMSPFGPLPAGPQAAATFTYTLMPLARTAQATPAIPFSYFDPQRAAYVDLTVPPVPVRVRAGTTPADLSALRQADTPAPDSEKEPSLSDLAAAPGLTARSLAPLQSRSWFPLLQVAPGLAFAALWGWDRRRRFLEQHPEVILRRRARRALRREWRALRQAARAGDASRFAAAAAAALRVACAPHYPADPRALVGADVLLLLPCPGRAPDAQRAAEVVRRVFAVTDAARFGAPLAVPSSTRPAVAEKQSDARAGEPPAASPGAVALLALEPELENVLQQLEERLWA